MASINILRRILRGAAGAPNVTHEGAPASIITPEATLRRLVMSCLLWEDGFYVNGREIAEEIRSTVAQVEPDVVAAIAIQAREAHKLRHVPLWIVREMARLASHKHLVAATLERAIQRPDEITEFVALYWKDGRQPLSAQVKKGLAAAFRKFDEYQLAKYDRDGAVRLRDVLFMVHAAPGDRGEGAPAVRHTMSERREGAAPPSAGGELFRKVAQRTLAVPDTWETALSAGADKRETFERLIAERKLGPLALLRNLRNMRDAGVPYALVRNALNDMRTERVLPFRFVAAARAVPEWEEIVEKPMLAMLRSAPKLSGRTGVLVDVSGSMSAPLSRKSDLTRIDAACALAMLVREIGQEVVVGSFSNALVMVPARRGFALRDAIAGSQPHGGTYLGAAVRQFAEREPVNRLIIITDEQSADPVTLPPGRTYMINVAGYRNGVAYGESVHIDGFSESVVTFIQELEALERDTRHGAAAR